MGMLLHFGLLVCSAAKRVVCSLVAVWIPYLIVLTPSPSRVYEVRAEPLSCPGRCGDWELRFHFLNRYHADIEGVSQGSRLSAGQRHSRKVLFDLWVDV